MKRLHLFEFEDQRWLPDFLRNYVTDFLQFISNKAKIYKPIVPIIEKGLILSGTNKIIDLGSGGGGGIVWLNQELIKNTKDLKIVLTDLYPNLSAFKYTQSQADNFEYIEEPVDARNVPSELRGLRTQFLSFHHFKPNDAKKILQNAINSGNSIAIFESQERSFASIFAMLLSPLSVLLTTPFIKPFKLGRLLFTYIIPIVPILILWDGVVSSLRTYSVKEMNELVNSLKDSETYNWEINKVKNGVNVILYLLGTKKR